VKHQLDNVGPKYANLLCKECSPLWCMSAPHAAIIVALRSPYCKGLGPLHANPRTQEGDSMCSRGAPPSVVHCLLARELPSPRGLP
jgi:hypothetical protein